MFEIGLSHYLTLGATIFTIGIVGIFIFIGLVYLCTPFSHKKNNKYGKYIS